MKEEIYQITNPKSFELKDIFECGQCFRWNPEKDGSYTGIWKNNVVHVQKENNNIIFQGITEDEIKQEIENYFDLNKIEYEFKKDLYGKTRYLFIKGVN